MCIRDRERVVQQSIFGTMQTTRTCSACHGTGKTVKEPCQTCRGTGYVKRLKKYEINIPKGIDHGQTIRLSGKGEAGINGGGYGDLLVTVYVKPVSYTHLIRTWAAEGFIIHMILRNILRKK